jgi:4-amino-4-deoxy-L-arabinose transferase-like glycosyltransferase
MSILTTSRALHLALLILLGVALLMLAWVGFIGSDDINYRAGAIGWLTEGWYVPSTHWDARNTVTLPAAAAIALLGDTEFAVVAPSALYFLLLVALTYAKLGTLMPRGHAAAATALLATIPVFSIHAGTVSADLAEAFWAIMGFWLVVQGTRNARAAPLNMVAAGIAIALAFMGRETVAGLSLFIGILMLAGYRIGRRLYWYAALGFLLVVGLEAVYYAVASGDPLRRIRIILSASSVADRVTGLPPFTLDDSGALRVWNPIDSFLLFLTKHNFGVVYYALIPICALIVRDAARATRRGAAVPEWLDQARLAVIAGIIWTLFAAVALYRMKILSRYYIVPTYLLTIATALWVSHVLIPQRRRLVALFLVAGIVVNLICISIDNNNPRPGERALVAYLARSSGMVKSDPLTAFRAQQFIAWSKLDETRIQSGPPQPGDVFLRNPHTLRHANRFMPETEIPLYAARPEWERLWTAIDEPPLIGRLLAALGLGQFVPPAYRTKLIGPRPEVVVYRIPN